MYKKLICCLIYDKKNPEQNYILFFISANLFLFSCKIFDGIIEPTYKNNYAHLLIRLKNMLIDTAA